MLGAHRNGRRWIASMLLVALSGLLIPQRPALAQDEREYDPLHTMLALNMVIVSVHRIIATEDRIVLDQEYQNIINNLNVGNIEPDLDLTSLYEELMDVISQKN